VRKTKLSIFASADHERVVLIESEIAAGLRASDNMQGYTHLSEYREFVTMTPIRLASKQRKNRNESDRDLHKLQTSGMSQNMLTKICLS
jgi:hypothetical protein